MRAVLVPRVLTSDGLEHRVRADTPTGPPWRTAPPDRLAASPDRVAAPPGRLVSPPRGPAEAVTVETPVTRAARQADPRPTGRTPGLVGLLLGVVALGGALVPVALPHAVLPATGMSADSGPVLAALVLLAVTALACSALGVGPARRDRAVGVVGLAAGGLALLTVLLPLAALAAV